MSKTSATLAQIAEEAFGENNCKIIEEINHTMVQLEETIHIVLKFPK